MRRNCKYVDDTVVIYQDNAAVVSAIVTVFTVKSAKEMWLPAFHLSIKYFFISHAKCKVNVHQQMQNPQEWVHNLFLDLWGLSPDYPDEHIGYLIGPIFGGN